MTETKIIAALAHACGLEWGTHWVCTGGYYALPESLRHTPWSGRVMTAWPRDERRSCDECGCTLWRGPASPLPDTLEAWQAEWAAEHPGEPGPVREWTSEDGRVRWATTDGCFVSITVGQLQAVRWMHVPGWAVGQDDDCTSADVADLARLMEAVDRAAHGRVVVSMATQSDAEAEVQRVALAIADRVHGAELAALRAEVAELRDREGAHDDE